MLTQTSFKERSEQRLYEQASLRFDETELVNLTFVATANTIDGIPPFGSSKPRAAN